jgi:hypothetical protein
MRFTVLQRSQPRQTPSSCLGSRDSNDSQGSSPMSAASAKLGKWPGSCSNSEVLGASKGLAGGELLKGDRLHVCTNVKTNRRAGGVRIFKYALIMPVADCYRFVESLQRRWD